MDYICGSEPSVQRFLERTRGWSTRMKCGELFRCGRREKEPSKLGVSGENKAMQRKNEVHYFWGDDSKYLGPESQFLKVFTLKAWEGLVVGKI